jgi:hypothetical protein
MGNQVGPSNKELDERRKQIESYWKDSKKGKTLRVSQGKFNCDNIPVVMRQPLAS